MDTVTIFLANLAAVIGALSPIAGLVISGVGAVKDLISKLKMLHVKTQKSADALVAAGADPATLTLEQVQAQIDQYEATEAEFDAQFVKDPVEG